MKPAIIQSIILIIISCLGGVGSNFLHPQKKRIKLYPPEPIKEKYVKTVEEILTWDKNSYYLFDARDHESYEKDHIPGAIHMTLEDAEDPNAIDKIMPYIQELFNGKKIVIYCSSDKCDKSREMSKEIRKKHPVKNVFVLKDGWKAWQEYHKK